MNGSIYDLILDNLDGDRLKEGFSLPAADEQGIRFADGAMDGIAVYHLDGQYMNAAQVKKMIRALKSCSAGDYKQADRLFSELGETFHAVNAGYEMQKYLIDRGDRLDLGEIMRSAERIVLNSADRESVKFGLIVTELLDPEEWFKEAVCRIGLCEEFTLFAVRNMFRWDEANEEIFNVARKVRAWGRIHAVHMLNPATPEIREWLLLHGVDNEVVPAYSALTVWNKAKVAERLKGDLTEDEFHAVGRIIRALLDEGPVRGISGVDDPEEPILDYLAKANGMKPGIGDYEAIMDIAVWASSGNVRLRSVSSAASELLSSYECLETVEEAVKNGEGLRLADALGIDYCESLYNSIVSDFDGQYDRIEYLIDCEEYVDPLIELFGKKLPLGSMSGEPTDNIVTGPDAENYLKLNAINQLIALYPGKGAELIAAGLRAPAVTTRKVAIMAIEEWTSQTGIPVRELSRPLFAELGELIEKEVNDNLKARIRDLLDGVIPEGDRDDGDRDDDDRDDDDDDDVDDDDRDIDGTEDEYDE